MTLDPDQEKAGDQKLPNGPQRDGEGINQTEIDTLFGQLFSEAQCQRLTLEATSGYRLSSRMARSRPSRVSGYMRPPISWRTSWREAVPFQYFSGTGFNHMARE